MRICLPTTAVRLVATTTLGAALVLVAPAATALAAPQAGQGTLASDANALRASAGVAGLTACVDLDRIAQAWASHEAATGTLAHNPDLASQMPNWQALAENVGEGTTVAGIATALQDSPPHRANLLNPTYTEAGFGVAARGSLLFVDEVFRQPMSGGCVRDSLSVFIPRIQPVVIAPPAQVAVPARASRSVTQRVVLTRQTAAQQAAAAARAASAVRAAERVRSARYAAVETVRISALMSRPATGSRDVVAAALAFHATLAGSLS